MLEQIPTEQLRLEDDYRILWCCIGPTDTRLGNGPIQLPEDMMPERRAMITIISRHAPGCPSCRGLLEPRLSHYLDEVKGL